MSAQEELDLVFLEIASAIKMLREPVTIDLGNISGSYSLSQPQHRAIYRLRFNGNVLLGAPQGSYSHGHMFVVEITQDSNGSRLLGLDAGYRFSDSIPLPSLSTAPDKLDRLGFQYHSGAQKWDLVAFSKGY